ncbi:GNAT family N-acetyltransferase [Sphingomicrobium clamense]|uniref:GNAT family N-acetyltransferase n=1 Tax=Sphingomicrobium clamense TaxID=2851013 RepID=A0ABS6V7P4_9SPHN|nr:GNAT family N-acetyltransferase [Sphingomicrobium sp. B8]MBW0145579.1 GNAT family N-acetyltransferase [Sphingomicrobium sp. B8]
MATSPVPREILLEPGGWEDIDAVMAVMDDAFPPCFGERWSKSQIAGVLPLTGVRLLLAHDGGAEAPIVGFALWRTVSDESELLLLAVHTSAQGQGLGRALLEDFAEQAIADGATRLHLEVRDGNPANRLYASEGFDVAGRRRAYYRGVDGERHDALTYVRMVSQ